MGNYVAYYRRRSDGDGDLLAVLATPGSENIELEEFQQLRSSLAEGVFLMSEADIEIFTVEGDICNFPDTYSEVNEHDPA